MSVTKVSKARPAAPTLVRSYVQLPRTLHEQLKTLRECRRAIEGADVKLCRLHREAIELYLAAKPQRELLGSRSAA